jgi:hypothetical protein
MNNLPFIERINILFEAIKNNEITKYFIPGILVLGIVLLIFSRSKGKVLKVLSGILSFGIIGFSIYYFYNPIMSFLDYLVEVIINNILFPNLALYIITILIIDIALLISILSNKVSGFSKVINIITFILMHILLFFIVNNIIVNNVDVYEMLSIYTNQELLVLVETNMIIFGIWIILHSIYKITKLLTRDKVKEEKEDINNNLVVNYNEVMEEPEFIEYVPIKKKRV